MVTSIVAGARPAEAQVQPTAECSTFGFLVQYPNGTDTTIYSVDMVTGETAVLFEFPGRTLNAAAFNPVDGYYYAFDHTNNEIVRVGGDGSLVGLGLPAGWDASVPNYFVGVGEIDANGTYWVSGADVVLSPTQHLWQAIDLTTFQVTDSGTATVPGANLADWAFSPVDDELYSVIPSADGTSSLVVRFDTATGTLVVVADLGALVAPDGTPVPSGGIFGAVYADADGFIYAQNNETGLIWRVDPAAGEATFFAYGPVSGFNDGVRCFNAPIPIDFGDAPDSYGTTLATDGARHAIPGFDDFTDTAPLMLGTTISVETDGQPSAAADLDTDDAVASPIVMVPGQPTTVSVTVTNNTAEPATLAGWIDLDGNGTFDPGERVTVTVPANSGTASYDLTFPPGTTTASTYARFRLFPGDVTDPLPTGGAAAGEVEDYLVEFEALDVMKTSDPPAGTPLAVGDTVTYTLTMTNLGTTDLTGEVVTDDLAGVLDDAVLASGPTLDPATAGTVEMVDGVMTFTGDVPAGGAVTVTYAVTVLHPSDTDGDAVLVNGVVGGQCPDPPITDPADPAYDPDCVIIHPIRATERLKTVDVQQANPGDTVTFTVTLTNVGTADYTADEPASFTDDVTGVLDDATFNDDATASIGDPPALDGTMLMWAGPLAAGEQVVVTYSVTVNSPATGDYVLANVVTTPDDPECPPDDMDCRTVTPIPGLDPVKTVDVEDAVPGDTVTYTVTLTNTGAVDYTAEAPASFTDDMSGVLDDATFNDDAAASPDAGELAYGDPVLAWSGPLAIGEMATFTYSVTVNDPTTGDGTLVNAVVTPEGKCVEGSGDPDCTTTVPIPLSPITPSPVPVTA